MINKKNGLKTITYLFALLFAYTSIVKLINYENFVDELKLSPVLHNFVQYAWLIPLIEIGIASILIIPRLKKLGSIVSLLFLLLSTIYLVVLLTNGVYLPCGCGGIFDELSLEVHVIMNVVFIGLAIIAILLQKEL